mgnify:CR=1 FL=1
MNNSKVLYLIIVILIGLLFLRECQNQAHENELISQITNYKDTAKVERLKNGALVYSNQILTLNSQEQLKTLSSVNDTIKLMLKKFKSVNNVTNINNQFFAGSDTIKQVFNIPCDFKPFKIRHGSDSTYRVIATIAKDYSSIDTVSLKDKETLIFGRKKIGFMKYDHSIDINHSNPYISTYGIKSYQYMPRKQWYERTWVHILTGALGESIIRQSINFYIQKH